MDKSRVSLGRWGEELVARSYESAGYEVLDRNWKIKGGELDLVLGRRGEIVFCEVKTRSSDRFGSAVEAVGPRKQQLLRRTALSWLEQHGSGGRLRFDVASVVAGRVTIITSAF
ncbi:MAG: YraN family protein [Acidimicrobiaceae bacterium]|nr:YraN family protein [Acidimicrobiaceae bacterium]MXW63166.1 YraN family protein [Acidimicrobiaceae bacterium]MXW77323.1 YraN family protein [Acidimicrobiaceae bacterium]MYA75715.1 YraN family protein [Acidimicrobiaceae bacterium]MYC41248.1 YraN family protein [Acidimicrobiaceae bacterium]